MKKGLYFAIIFTVCCIKAHAGELPPYFVTALDELALHVQTSPIDDVGRKTLGESPTLAKEFDDVSVNYQPVIFTEQTLRRWEQADANMVLPLGRISNSETDLVEWQSKVTRNIYLLIEKTISSNGGYFFALYRGDQGHGTVVVPDAVKVYTKEGKLIPLSEFPISDRVKIPLTRFIRLVVFEEFFHLLERKLNLSFGIYALPKLNDWLTSLDIPIMVEYDPRFLAWRERHGVGNSVPGVLEKLQDLSGISGRYFMDISETTVYLEMKKRFDSWMDHDLIESLISRHPRARDPRNPILQHLNCESRLQRKAAYLTPAIIQ